MIQVIWSLHSHLNATCISGKEVKDALYLKTGSLTCQHFPGWGGALTAPSTSPLLAPSLSRHFLNFSKPQLPYLTKMRLIKPFFEAVIRIK